jgi:heme-degrading monooxygenase HmoA
MFAVLFEVHPASDQWDAYLGYAKLLRPELEKVEGFVDNVRYRSLTREGWLLSLSGWRDEKALVRWRTQAVHHGVQEKGRNEIMLDYHLRVGQLTRDTHTPAGQALQEQRLDETQAGAATTVVLVDATRPAQADTQEIQKFDPVELARWLGLPSKAAGLVSWDVFDAVLTPGDLILLMSWQSEHAALAYEASARPPLDARMRRVRVVRDYGMFDRREAPQYYPAVPVRNSN